MGACCGGGKDKPKSDIKDQGQQSQQQGGQSQQTAQNTTTQQQSTTQGQTDPKQSQQAQGSQQSGQNQLQNQNQQQTGNAVQNQQQQQQNQGATQSAQQAKAQKYVVTSQPIVMTKTDKISLNFEGNLQQIQANVDWFCKSIIQACPKQIELQNFSDQKSADNIQDFRQNLFNALNTQSTRTQGQTIGQGIQKLLVFDYRSGVFNNFVNELLAVCVNLEEIYIHSEGAEENQGITDEQVKNLIQLKKLQKINLNGNIEGRFLTYCQDMQLKSISLNNKMSQEVVIPYLEQKGKDLNELILQDIKYSSDVIAKCPNITQLEIISIKKKLVEKDIISIHNHPTPFQQLKFMHLDQINLKFFDKFFDKQHSDLQILNLTGCREISDKSIELIARNCPKLVKLWLCKCIYLTNAAIQNILLKYQNLQYLNLEAITNINDQAFIFNDQKQPFQSTNEGQMLDIWKKLTILDVSDCTGVPEQYIKLMRNNLPNTSIRQSTFFKVKTEK